MSSRRITEKKKLTLAYIYDKLYTCVSPRPVTAAATRGFAHEKKNNNNKSGIATACVQDWND